jgi:hypothetical protein
MRKVGIMDTLIASTAMIASVGAAYAVQRALLGALLQAIDPNRKSKG